MRCWFLLFCVVLWPLALSAQELEEGAFADLVYQLGLEPDEVLAREDWLEGLYQLYRMKADLNAASDEEIGALPMLTAQEAEALLAYRATQGPLLSIYELQAVPGLSMRTVRRMLPFVQVREPDDVVGRWLRLREEGDLYGLLRYSRRLPEGRGYRGDSAAFAGSPDYLLMRWRLRQPGSLSVGLQAEKDAGEALGFGAYRTGFDHVSGHVQVEAIGKVERLLLGDFRIAAGQGLVHGGGFGLGKGAEPVLYLRRAHRGLLPHTGAAESGFMRGAGATVGEGRVQGTIWLSALGQDATVAEDSTGLSLSSGISATGLHRTVTERAKRNSIEERQAGFLLDVRGPGWHVGGGATGYRFSVPLPRKSQPYGAFDFAGAETWVGHVYGSRVWYNWNVFGEVARWAGGGVAALAGAQVYLHPKVQAGLLWRRYARDAFSFYGDAFGERSRVQNEYGTFFGLRYSPDRRWLFSGYVDRFRFPWLRYGVDAPSEGYEWLLAGQFRWQRGMELRVQWREEHDARNSTMATGPTRLLQSVREQQLRVQLQLGEGDGFSTRTRLQWNGTRDELGLAQGWALSQDVFWKRRRLSLSGRLALFSTDGFSTRVYSYERDVLYAFSVPAYQGQGLRSYVLLGYRLTPQWRVWLRYGRYFYLDRESVGSGYDTAPGNVQEDVRVQVMWKPWAGR